MIRFAAESAAHVGDAGKASGQERLRRTQRAHTLLAAADQLRVFWKVLLNIRDKLGIGRHPGGASDHERDVFRSGDMPRVKLLDSAHVQINVTLPGVEQDLGFFRIMAFGVHGMC